MSPFSHIVKKEAFLFMKVKNMMISLIFMGVLTVILLVIIGIGAYYLKFEADIAMLLITVVYIFVGASGGVAHAFLERIQMKRSVFGPNLLQTILGGVVLGSAYMLILLICAFLMVKTTIDDWLRFVILWLMVCGSCLLGKILFGRKV